MNVPRIVRWGIGVLGVGVIGLLPAGRLCGGAEDEDSVPHVGMSRSGYISKLEKIDPKETSRGGLSLKAAIVPDGYRYLMAKELATLEDDGYEGKEIVRKLRPFHIKYKKYKEKALFLATLSGGGPDSYLFFAAQPKQHVEVRQGTKKTLTLLDVDPAPKYEIWKVFDGTGQGFARKKLWGTTKVRMVALSSSVKTDDKEPIELTFLGIAVQSKKADFNSSVNPDLRQVSSRSWAEITVSELTASFKPGRWKLPDPPSGFDEILEMVDR